MKYFLKSKLIEDFLTSGLRIKDESVKQRVTLLNAFTFLGILINLNFGLLNLYTGNTLAGVVELVIFILYLGNLVYLRKTRDLSTSINVALGLAFGNIMFIYVAKGFSGTGYYWSALFPLLVLFLISGDGWKKWIYSYFFTVVVLVYMQTNGRVILVLDRTGMIIWNLVVVAITAVGLFYRSYINRSKQIVEDRSAKTEELLEEIKNQKTLLDTVLDTISSPIYTKDKEGRYSLVNKSFVEEVYGSKKENVLGKNDLEIKNHINDESKKKYYLEDLEFMILPNSAESTDRYKFKDNRFHDVIVNKTTILNTKDEVSGMVGVLTDITTVIEAKKEIEAEKEKFETILASIGDGVIVLDKNKKIILVNQVTEELSSYSRDELIGTVYHEKLNFISSKTGRELKGFIDRVYTLGERSSMDKSTVIRRRNGEEIAVGDSAAPIFDAQHNVIGCIIVFRDASVDVEIDRSKTEFISVVSHQLKTPLTSLKWLAQLLNNDSTNLTPEQTDTIKSIEETASKMSTMVNDLLDVSRIESGKKFAVIPEKADLIEVIKMEIDKLSFELKSRSQIIKLLPTVPETDILKIDKEKIGQVFHNLFSNAQKYSPEKAEIQIGFEKKGDDHVYFVKDQGIGIPKEEQNKIFEKFFRAKNTQLNNVQISGTGLGLYIVQKIIEGHNGKVWFESEQGKGTTFFISLKAK